MKKFKSVDEDLEANGFQKIEESEDIVVYERQHPDFVQVLELGHRAGGWPVMLSYQKGVNKEGQYNAVSLTVYEAHRAMVKMEQKGW